MTWKIQQTILKTRKESITPNDIVIAARRIQKPRDRALFVILYLTAGRISEIVKTLYRKDISEQEVDCRRIILFRLINRKSKDKKLKDIPVRLS